MLEKQGGIGMYRENIDHLFVGDPSHRLHQLTGCLCSISQVAKGYLPICQNNFVLILLHGCTHELECNIFRQAD